MDNRPVLMNSSRVQILFSGLKKIAAKWVKNMWKLIKERYVRFPSVSHFALLAECLNFGALFSIATVFDHELKILLRLVLFSWRNECGEERCVMTQRTAVEQTTFQVLSSIWSHTYSVGDLQVFNAGPCDGSDDCSNECCPQADNNSYIVYFLSQGRLCAPVTRRSTLACFLIRD